MWDDVSFRWFKSVSWVDPGFTHPQFVWDATPHAGASQAHTHTQLFMGRGSYIGKVEALSVAAQNYYQEYGR